MKNSCACGHDHHKHEHHHDHSCGCGHEHHHAHHDECAHDHGAHAPCCCGHDHDHDHGCACGHDHGEHTGRALAVRAALTLALLAAGHILPLAWLGTLCCIAAYLVAGYDVLLTSWRNIRKGRVFDEKFLMSVASLGAMAVGESAEGVMVMLLYQLGEYLQHRAADTSRRSIAALLDVRPDHALVLDGEDVRRVSPEAVQPGDLIRVQPGEKIPLDGVIESGDSALDTAALTGESLPRDVGAGDRVLSGCVNLTGVLTIRVTAAYAQSTAAKILDLVEQSGRAKASTERFITRFSRWYTPAVCGLAVLIALLPGLVTGQWRQWLYTALTFLVISCPCALVISVPLTFFSGVGGLSRRGVLVKGANHLESLAGLDAVALDKTGTLTRGVFAIDLIEPVGMPAEELLHLAAQAEIHSSHPIAAALRAACDRPLEPACVTDLTEIAGRGLAVRVGARQILCGSRRLLEERGVAVPAIEEAGAAVYVAADGRYAGCIRLADQLKPGARETMAALREAGVQHLVMLTGDNEAAAAAVAGQAGVTGYHASLLPADKVTALEALLKKGKTAFVGDGMNDAPVLRRADVGVAMGGLGSDAAIEAADIVLMDDDLGKLPLAIRAAKKTLAIARENIAFALLVKLAVMLLGVLGAANMWLAVFADVGVAMLCILNALRAMR